MQNFFLEVKPMLKKVISLLLVIVMLIPANVSTLALENHEYDVDEIPKELLETAGVLEETETDKEISAEISEETEFSEETTAEEEEKTPEEHFEAADVPEEVTPLDESVDFEENEIGTESIEQINDLLSENAAGFAGGSGTELDPYMIENESQLNEVRNYLNCYFVLENDITLTSKWIPIGTESAPFTGCFDGDGYVIKGLNIDSADTYVGLFGYNKGTIKNLGIIDGVVKATSSSSAYVGGIAGYNNGTISNCYNTGNVSATSSPSSYVTSSKVYAGGIVAYNYLSGTVSNCYNIGTISAIIEGTSTLVTSSFSSCAYAGGIVGSDYFSSISNCYNTGIINANVIVQETSDRYPAYAYAGGIVGSSGWKISTCYNKGDISASVSASSSSSLSSSSSAYVYAGGIAGDSRDISNCYSIGNIYASLSISSSPSSSEKAYAGGIVGHGHGTINNCYNTGDINASAIATYFDAYAGGIEGYGSSTISDCYNTGDICANTGINSVFSDAYAGGIAGYNSLSDTISNCYNMGDVSAISYNAYAGGIAGYNGGTLNNCYYLDVISKGIGSGSGNTTALSIDQMKVQDSFVGFDFEDVWQIGDGGFYLFPTLKSVKHVSIKLGDVNNDDSINVLDANIIRLYVAELVALNEGQMEAADVNVDGKVDVVDANIIRRYAAKLITDFSA